MLEFAKEYLPVLIVGAIIGAFSVVFIMAYMALRKSKKEDDDTDRHMADGEIVRRLLRYAKPYWKSFVVTFVVMVFSIGYEILSPLLISHIQDTLKTDFELAYLWQMVALYAGILVVSLICTYVQAMILQRTGMKILSQIRQDVFTHIEGLSHEQLNNIPVGKLVTRVTNDPNAISYMFTNIIVTLAKNCMVIVGVLAAMLLLNYALTLMVLCFVPFVVLFTVIFRKFSRKVHRKVSNTTTDVNTYLSENLSGMKITQIFNREEKKYSDFKEKSANLRKAKMGRMYVFGVFRPMVYMLFESSQMCLFYFGAKGYITKTEFLGQVIDSGVLVAFYMYISRFFNPIQTLAEQFDMLQRSFASSEKIFGILDMVFFASVTRMLVNRKEMALGSLVTLVTSLPTGMLLSCSWLNFSMWVYTSVRMAERIF